MQKITPTNTPNDKMAQNKPKTLALAVTNALAAITTATTTAQTPTLSQSGSSRGSSRRASSALAREPLPTPPPDPRANGGENVFKFPPNKQDFPPTFHGLMDFKERQVDFYKTLNKSILDDCQRLHTEAEESQHHQQHEVQTDNIEEIHRCDCCAGIRRECSRLLGPLQQRTSASISATLVAYGAMDQLARMYSIWDQYLDVQNRLRKRKECLQYINLLEKKANEEVQAMKKRQNTSRKENLSDTETELEQSISLLGSILAEERSASVKRTTAKPQRERSKSVMVDDMMSFQNKEREARELNLHPVLRRQSTYSDGKAKVSKWTKVKAAFKWERANVPALQDCSKESMNHVGLTPINNEVARYLRVPSAPCGAGSSADSILSSSSGHLLSEIGETPGTMSSASSVDDLDTQRPYQTSRRDSAKSDTAIELSSNCSKSDISANLQEQPKTSGLLLAKSPTNKSFRKSKIISDFEVLPEDVIADIKSTPVRRTKLPPSPLDLSIKQDLNDLESFYSPNLLKSPDSALSSCRSKKLNSPGNSSVPSSPSRHSDFFAEFESEDVSSGEFSEPATPTHNSFQQKQKEINQRYQILRAKLDKEFEAKRLQWEKMKTNPNSCRALALLTTPKSEEISPKPAVIQNLNAKQLEENLTPEFKKKLRKWRVKKQVPVGTSQSHHQMPMSPNTESKAKIDWHLWKTGQVKLEGQGLSILPDQKTLPEDFQKKLEQWDKIKRSGGTASNTQDTVKRSITKADFGKKSSDDDRGTEKRSDKIKTHETNKTEKLAKLKGIGKLTDHPVKKIEVKTSAGVMKFEGISRKFTRKLYEWEKARGIGPESSTFALLHPGYCPIDVGRIPKESTKNENSPTMSRSLSLDSISVVMPTPIISQQASSLSLNDVKDLKEMESSTDILNTEVDYKKFEEPEAVMVEVEDHIVETASPLVAVQTVVEHQTPVYKYEEVACNDYCNLKRVVSYESSTNIAPLLAALSRTDKLLNELKKLPQDLIEESDIRNCNTALSFVRQIYPFYTENLDKTSVLNAILDVQTELSRLDELMQKYSLGEACCQETMNDNKETYTEELKGLNEALEILRHKIHDGFKYPREAVPDINITSEDGHESSIYAMCNTSRSSKDQLSTTLEATDEVSVESILEPETKPPPTPSMQRTFSTNSAAGGAKKKFRLRKIGSRQNSKTESDSSDEPAPYVSETPRRIKRKNFRFKQRSFDDDYRRFESTHVPNIVAGRTNEPMQQNPKIMAAYKTTSRSLVTLHEPSPLSSIPEPLTNSADINVNDNVFVKTKRKVFTTVKAPITTDGIAVIERVVDPLQQSMYDNETVNNKPTNDIAENIQEKSKPNELNLLTKPKNLVSQKSISVEDVTSLPTNEHKLRSTESLQSLGNQVRNFRTSLASDSFLINAKNYVPLKRSSTNSLRNSWSESKREHLFKKNSNAHSKTNGVTGKKIETKVAKTNSGSSVENTYTTKLDRSDNTLPKIYRRSSRHSMTPTTITSEQFKFDYPTPTCSEPNSPFFATEKKPLTPLSERAQKLRIAKAEFLKNNQNKRREETLRNEYWEQARQSDLSLSSAAGAECANNLSKSVSADTFTATPVQSDAGTDADTVHYDSLPRVSRSAKITSKLGFATLASKFRRGKAKKDKESSTSIESGTRNALSALCKQTLMADIITAPQVAQVESHVYGVARHECIISKSSSSPQPVVSDKIRNSLTGQVRKEIERLNKSQSEKTIKPKESYV